MSTMLGAEHSMQKATQVECHILILLLENRLVLTGTLIAFQSLRPDPLSPFGSKAKRLRELRECGGTAIMIQLSRIWAYQFHV